MQHKFDAIFVGTGFASSFFLKGYLEKAGADARVLVLERGQRDTHQWRVANRRYSSQDPLTTFENQTPEKPWVYTPSFGGGSNCWWGVTPRLMPSDFELQSTYGIGRDWPLRYADLEPFYTQAEEIMAISGPQDGTPFPMSVPYPQPPHRFSAPDERLKAAFPDQFFQLPTARPRLATPNRPACCANGVCGICPIDSKFTILNELGYLYEDSRVALWLGTTVEALDITAGQAQGVVYKDANGAAQRVQGELIVLGANALFNPYILLNSGLDHPQLGRNLNEQVGVNVRVHLRELDNFQGSTSITGHGYMFYDHPQRGEHAGCLLESWNYGPWIYAPLPHLRFERGKWRQSLLLKFIFEELPQTESYVSRGNGKPRVTHAGHSVYLKRGLAQLPHYLDEVLQALPVEDAFVDEPLPTEAHILGTTVMGTDPENSIIDAHLIHHQMRNVVVLGGGAFPTSSPSNPTLTISALALWAAEQIL